ncbi:synemin [Latimeria chalumnae]|uniref:synemin n=1 Tax=Latimeria chalumnae TaxID=7897 RepID=UPI0003C1ADDA|nr:PREDICTED: synemin [Latimeria chalumnae]|eukprot:XP_006007233.1 PREDICTED: synemin [Latimeria chalumnae]
MSYIRSGIVDEKSQLQELNNRLELYLTRVRDLEEENRFLATEIHSLRHQQKAEWQREYESEIVKLRRKLEQLSLDKLTTEFERDNLWQEFQQLQTSCSEEQSVRKRISAELAGCKNDLQQANTANDALEDFLLQLQDECKIAAEVHEREVAELRAELCNLPSLSVATRQYHGPALTMKDVENYTHTLSQAWKESFKAYQAEIEELEDAVRTGRERQEDVSEEKRLLVLEVEELRGELIGQNDMRETLEEELLKLRDKYSVEMEEYQMVIDSLEDEKESLAVSIAGRLKDYRELMQAKMGLILEVTTYRALLEGESNEFYLWTDQHKGRAPAGVRTMGYGYNIYHSQSERGERQPFPATKNIDRRYKDYRKNTRDIMPKPPLPRTRTPITSNFSDRDLLDSSATVKGVASARATVASTGFKKLIPEHVSTTRIERQVKIVPENRENEPKTTKPTFSAKESKIRAQATPKVDSKTDHQSKYFKEETTSLESNRWSRDKPKVESKEKSKDQIKSEENTTVEVETKHLAQQIPVSLEAQQLNLGQVSEDSEIQITLKGLQIETIKSLPTGDSTEVNIKEHPAALLQEVEVGSPDRGHNVYEASSDQEVVWSEKALLDNITVADILEKIVKPAGLEKSLTTSPEAKITYHVERKEVDADGKMKTEIVLKSTVEEDLDSSDESFLEELLNKNVKRTSLDNIKGTPTGNMIENIISLGLKGKEGIENKAVCVEIIDEPLESPTDENVEVEYSTPFKIEELEDTSSALGEAENDEVLNISMTADEFKKKMKVKGDTGYAVEVTKSDDTSNELKYIVSTPDDFPLPQYQTQESSHEFYFEESEERTASDWQESTPDDDKLLNMRIYENDPETEFSGLDDTVAYRLEKKYTTYEFPIETSVMEEEVEVPHHVQTSIVELLDKEETSPNQQLKGTLEQLKGKMSEELEEELSLLTYNEQKHSESMGVDIKKVQQTSDSGMVTIVAEINVSQNLETKNPKSREYKEDKINWELSSSNEAEDQGSHETVTVQGLKSIDPLAYKNGSHINVGSSSDYQKESFIRQGEHQTTELRIHPVPVSAGPGTVINEEHDDMSYTQMLSTDTNRAVRHITLGPSETSFTFQMDVTKVTPMNSVQGGTQDTGVLFLHKRHHEGADKSQLENVLSYDEEGTECAEDESVSVSLSSELGNRELQTSGEEELGQSVFQKALQLQRMADPRSVVLDDEKIAALYLDEVDED